MVRLAARQTKYTNYLKAHGASSEATRYIREMNAGMSVKTLSGKYFNAHYFGAFDVVMMPAFWSGGLLIMANIIWSMILLAFVSVLFWRRNSRERNGYRPDDIFTYTVALVCLGLISAAIYQGQASATFNYFQFMGSMFNPSSPSSGLLDSPALLRALLFLLGMAIPIFAVIGSIIYAAIRRRAFAQRLFCGLIASLSLLSLFWLSDIQPFWRSPLGRKRYLLEPCWLQCSTKENTQQNRSTCPGRPGSCRNNRISPFRSDGTWNSSQTLMNPKLVYISRLREDCSQEP